MNIMSQMSQWSQGSSDLPSSKDHRPSLESLATSYEDSQGPKASGAPFSPGANAQIAAHNDVQVREERAVASPGLARPSSTSRRLQTPEKKGFTALWFNKSSQYSEKKLVKLLVKGVPKTTRDYAEHLYKVACLLYDGELSHEQTNRLERKYVSLTASVAQFAPSSDPSDPSDPSQSQLYLVVEKCFDVFIRMSMNSKNMVVATHTIRFLTSLIMLLNYWELYHLLRIRPAIYQFLTLIDFDLQECYTRFVADYHQYTHKQSEIEQEVLRRAADDHKRKRRSSFSDVSSPEASDIEAGSFDTLETSGDHGDRGDRATRTTASPMARDKAQHARKRQKSDAKLAVHKVLPKDDFKVAPSTRSSNYDPDVVHECQLPSPEDPGKVCLRRFSRKYELIRHQETVHLKKKKLFKCYVCVKQDPSIGPRIFTRHDTLAKHIRVNHRISGKEAKAEVAYSKKHAEIVEEGDITVHVGRRKTKVDFELRAHMDKKGAPREAPDGSIIFDEIDELAPDSIHSGEEGVY